MQASNVPCCVSTLQQQDQITQQFNQDSDEESGCCKQLRKNCTVVENGRVVVKPIAQAVLQEKAEG
jgi:hypothetical protein